jgi:hypothetical protein
LDDPLAFGCFFFLGTTGPGEEHEQTERSENGGYDAWYPFTQTGYAHTIVSQENGKQSSVIGNRTVFSRLEIGHG